MGVVCLATHTMAKTVNLPSSDRVDSPQQLQDVIDCGTGWIFSDELGCILINTDNKKTNLTWAEAQVECESMDGFLVEIHGEKEQEFLKSQIKFLETLIGRHSYWIGATDFGKEGDWIWIASRQPVTYSSWDANRPNQEAPNQDDCVLLDCWKSNSQCDWRDYSCNKGTFHDYSTSFICQKYEETIESTTGNPTTETTVTTTASASTTSKVSCPMSFNSTGGSWTLINESCYLYERYFVGRDKAITFCESKGGKMIEINSKEESDIILAYKDLLGINYDFWLGINKMGTKWEWLSGDPLDWTNWEEGEPNDDVDCASVNGYDYTDDFHESFKWYDYYCGNTETTLCEA